MKKLGVIVLLSVFLFGFIGSFVSAQEILKPLADGAVSFYNTILGPFAKFLLGKNTEDGELLFGKLLLFTIVLSIVWLVADKFPLMTGKKKTGFVVAIAVAVLSVRYITPDWLEAIILPYSTLGVALTSFIPFVIYFFFVKELPTRSMRKIAWIFAFVVFAGLFLYRNAAVTNTVTLTPFGFGFSSTTPGFNPSYIYLITAVLSLIMLWFDGTIQRALAKAMYQDLAEIKKVERRAELIDEYDKIQDKFMRRVISKADANKLINSLKQRAKAYKVDKTLFTVIP